MFMVATDVTGVGGCFARWLPATNAFYLGNDAATGWMGPIQGGSGNTLQNSQCTLSGATSSGGGSGNTLTVRVDLYRRLRGTQEYVHASLGGRRQHDMAAGGDLDRRDAATAHQRLSDTGIGSGSSQVFTATHSDVQGFADISEALFMVASDPSGVGGCFVRWLPASNMFYLGDDTASLGTGPILGGSGNTLQNSQCTLSGTTSSGSGSGKTLTVRFALSFAGGFGGTMNTYLRVSGSAGSTNWQPVGTWIP